MTFREDKDIKHCKDCIYWRSFGVPEIGCNTEGNCRRYPPRDNQRFPEVWSHCEICGEFEDATGEVVF